MSSNNSVDNSIAQLLPDCWVSIVIVIGAMHIFILRKAVSNSRLKLIKRLTLAGLLVYSTELPTAGIYLEILHIISPVRNCPTGLPVQKYWTIY
jgi:hypothetical protein